MESGIFDKNGKELKIGDKVKNILTFYSNSGSSEDWYGTESQCSFTVYEEYLEYSSAILKYKQGAFYFEFYNGEELWVHDLLNYDGSDVIEWFEFERNFEDLVDFLQNDSTIYDDDELYEQMSLWKAKLKAHRGLDYENQYSDEGVKIAEEYSKARKELIDFVETYCKREAMNFEIIK